MATQRNNAYGAFNFLVSFAESNPSDIVAGFSDVSGLGVEINYSEYRNGNDPQLSPRKTPNTYKSEDVTLKRGLIGSTAMFEWVKNYMFGGVVEPKSVVITLLDEARQEVATFTLMRAQPAKWVGPTLAAKGGGEVAMEELHLKHEGITYA